MNKRQVDLLMFLCTSNIFTTARFLAEKYHVSTKTIYKDLDVLLDYLSKTKLKLIRKPRVGIKINGSDSDKRDVLRGLKELDTSPMVGAQFTPENRRSELVRRLILNDKTDTLKNLSEYWLVSKTSILGDIEVVNRMIESSGGRVQSNGSLLHFVGNEEQRQVAVAIIVVTQLSNQTDKNVDQLEHFFSPTVVNSVNDVFNILKRQWFSGLPPYYLFTLRIIITIQIYRLTQGVHFNESEKINENLKARDTYQLANQLLSMNADHLNFQYRDDDINRLSRNLSAYRLGAENRQDNHNWEATINLLIKRMETIQKTNFLGVTQLKKQLLYHIPAMVLRLQQGMPVHNPLLEDIKNQYPDLFGMTWYALSFLEVKYDISLNDDEVSFVTIYFHIALNKIMPQNHILIVYGRHTQFHGYVESQIQQLLPANTKFIQVSINDIKRIDMEQVCMVIAVDVKGVIVDQPVVLVSSLIDARDQANILIKYAQAVILKQKPIKKMHFNVLKDVIDPELIFWKDHVGDKRHALDFLIDHLESRGVVLHSFRESIYRRERLSSTEIEGGAALPHASPETVKQLAVAILIMKKPIWWNTQNVSIIILTCVPNEKVDVYRSLILDVYRLVQNKKMVHKIIDLQNTKSLIKLIKQ